jgi:hypothetical protein
MHVCVPLMAAHTHGVEALGRHGVTVALLRCCPGPVRLASGVDEDRR